MLTYKCSPYINAIIINVFHSSFFKDSSNTEVRIVVISETKKMKGWQKIIIELLLLLTAVSAF